MRTRTYKTEGIILKRQNLGEADRILTILTKHRGKISCIAKGVRKPTSRKSGHVELFNRTILYFAKGKNLDVLTQAQVIEGFSGIRKNLKTAKAAYHVVELVDQLTRENQENPEVYMELNLILRTINQQQLATQNQITNFEARISNHLGFGTPNKINHENMKKHIESIIEKKLNTVEIFKKI